MRKTQPKRTIVKLLEARYGKGEPHIDFLESVASGKAIKTETDMPGVYKLVTPTLDQMIYCRELLMAYQHGRPRQSIDIEVSDERPPRNYDALSVRELEQLEALSRKTKALTEGSNVVDAQFTPTGENKK